MANLTKFYDQAKDQHVANFIVYGKTGDKKVYYESSYTTQVASADLEDAFKKGRLLVFDGTNYLVPIVYAAGKVTTFTMGASAVESVTWTAK